MHRPRALAVRATASRLSGSFFSSASREQYQRPHHRDEQDEFLAERVEAAIVKIDRRDRVRNVSLPLGLMIDHLQVTVTDAVGAGNMGEAAAYRTAIPAAPAKKRMQRPGYFTVPP